MGCTFVGDEPSRCQEVEDEVQDKDRVRNDVQNLKSDSESSNHGDFIGDDDENLKPESFNRGGAVVLTVSFGAGGPGRLERKNSGRWEG